MSLKQIFSFFQNSWVEILGIILLFAMYGWGLKLAGPPTGKELYLIEAAREAFHNHHLFYPSYNHVLNIPISPLITALISVLFKFLPTTFVTARTFELVVALLSLFIVYTLGAQVFHPSVGFLTAGFMIATWGFFTNSHIVNGAVFYFLIVLLIFILFYQWFDGAFRSKTYAKSLYYHFIAIGCLLGIAFCTYGFPGVLYPLAIMLTTILLSNKPEVIADVHYPWMYVPLGIISVLWIILGSILMGVVPFMHALFNFSPSFSFLGEPFLYLLPIIPLALPALIAKDIWGRGLLTYGKVLILMFSWFAWSFVFLLFFSNFHEAFSLLAMTPPLLWIGFYLNEVFRNPVVPKPLQWTVDSIILIGLLLSICCILLTFQIVPPNMVVRFLLLSFLLPTISVLLLLLRDYTISRNLPFYLIPCGLLLCLMAKYTFTPLMHFQPTQAFSQKLHTAMLDDPDTLIVEWVSQQNTPSLLRFIAPMKDNVIDVTDESQVISLIQSRKGPVYLVLPEKQYFDLPQNIREMGYSLDKSWQWRSPLTILRMIQALENEMLDFKSLTEPVYLVKFPLRPL